MLHLMHAIAFFATLLGTQVWLARRYAGMIRAWIRTKANDCYVMPNIVVSRASVTFAIDKEQFWLPIDSRDRRIFTILRRRYQIVSLTTFAVMGFANLVLASLLPK